MYINYRAIIHPQDKGGFNLIPLHTYTHTHTRAHTHTMELHERRLKFSKP